MTDQAFSIAFHIGAHKTATSHLQRSLWKASDALAERGVRFYGPKTFRVPGGTLPARFGFRAGRHVEPSAISPANELANLRKDGQRLVLSEENYMGALNLPQGFTEKQRYADAGKRLTLLAKAIGHEIDIFLAVRRPTAFLNSAYGQKLLSDQLQPFPLYQKQNPLSSVDWPRLVAGVRAAEGVGNVTVWRYEDYAEVFPKITGGLVGAVHTDLVKPVRTYVNRGLSVKAVAHVMARAGEDVEERAAAIARKTFPVEAGRAAFDGYSPKEHEIGDAIYANQIAAIAELEGVTLLQP